MSGVVLGHRGVLLASWRFVEAPRSVILRRPFHHLDLKSVRALSVFRCRLWSALGMYRCFIWMFFFVPFFVVAVSAAGKSNYFFLG